MSLDDHCTELLPPEKPGLAPKVALTTDEHAKNNLLDGLARRQSLVVVIHNVNRPNRIWSV